MVLTRLIAVMGVVMALVFALVLGVIRAQPYDDGGVAAFLTDGGGCVAPCFMGITPGIPDRESALEILREHPWVRHAWLDFQSGTILWYWSDQAPALIETTMPGQIIPYFASGSPVIQIRTRIPLARLWINYGVPRYGSINPQPSHVFHNFLYPDAFFSGATAINCPAKQGQFFDSPVTLFWQYPPDSLQSYQNYSRIWRNYITC
jgi:hypothetical protein